MKASAPVFRTAKQIAHELGCSPATVYRLARKGVLPVQKGCSGGKTSRFEIERKSLDVFRSVRKG